MILIWCDQQEYKKFISNIGLAYDKISSLCNPKNTVTSQHYL